MNKSSLKPIAVLGAGSWGTALALCLGRTGQTVHLWSIEADEMQTMKKTRVNQRYHPGIILPPSIQLIDTPSEAIANANDILIVVPSHAVKQTLNSIQPNILPSHRIICASKGLDPHTHQFMNEVTETVLGPTIPFAALSGPSFAKDVANGLPVAVDLASKDPQYLVELTERFNSPLFRTYTTEDVKGVELGGVIKNVYAILTGISDGLRLGSSARAALITQALSEMIQLGKKLGAKEATFIGLSGIGDLILTCSDDLSRNRRFGLAIGGGASIEAAEISIGQVVEGKINAQNIYDLARKVGLSLPLITIAHHILNGIVSAKEGMQSL